MIGKYAKRKPVICNLAGIYTANAFNPSAVVVIHAPRACSHLIAGSMPYLKERYRKSGVQVPFDYSNLYVTGLTDKEAIFGGEQKLERCLRDVIAVRHPSYIMVAGGCVAGVIGDDIEAVCRRVEEDTGTPILHTDGCGFMNDTESDPYTLTTRLLLEKFSPLKPSGEKDKTVVMLGEQPINNKKSVTECINRLFRYFGLQDVLYPIGGMDISEFPALNRVSLALAGRGQSNKRKEIHAFTQQFAETLGIPCNLDHLPETPAEVCGYLRKTGKLLGEPALAEKAVVREQSLIDDGAKEFGPVLEKHRCLVAFVFSYDFAMPERIITLLEEGGVPISGFILLPEMAEAESIKYRKALERYGKPVYTEEEYLQQSRQEKIAEYAYTVIEKPYFAKQFVTTKRHIGAAGICDLWKQLAQFLEQGRRMYYED